jgi:vacuolar-type H+-ATPase subunit H
MFWRARQVVVPRRSRTVTQRDSDSEPTGISVLDDVLQAESQAESALDTARGRHDGIVAAARSEAQEIERRTDRRIEACRRLFTERTQDLVRSRKDAAGRAPPPVEVGDAEARRAARTLAMRLVGIPR